MKKSALFLVLAISLILLFSSAYNASAPKRNAVQAFPIAPSEKVDPRIRPAISSHTDALVDVYVETLDPHALGELLRSHGVETNIGVMETNLPFPVFVRVKVPAHLVSEIASLPSTGYIISYQRPELLEYPNPKLIERRVLRADLPRPTGQWSAFYHGAMQAWEEYGEVAMGENVTVAILDSGIDFAQADLQWTWLNYSDPNSPYFGRPVVFDSSSLLDWLNYGIAFPRDRGSWFSDTSYTAQKDENGYIEYRGHKYYVGDIESASGTFHFGFHPDEFLNTYYNQTLGIPWTSDFAPVAVLVVDSHQPGVYDTVYVDLDADFDFTDEKPATYQDPLVYKDVYDHENDTYDFDHWDHGDGYPDLSGGIVAFIADGETPLPYSERVSQLLGMENRIPGNGNLVFFFGELGLYGTGHGTMCASSVAGQGKTAGYKIGMAPKAKLIGIRLFGPSEDIYLSWLFAVEGFDGVPGTGDEPDITSNSYGYSAIHWDGWDEHDKYLDFLLYDYAQDEVLFFIAAGNGGPGYGTITTPDPRSAVNVGASLIYKSYAYLREVGNWEYAMVDDPVDFSARGPSATGLNGISVMANGFADWEAVAPNIIVWYFGRFDGGYGWLMWGTGTSHASPTAAGAAADILSAFKAKYGYKPKASVIKAILMQSAKDIYMDPFTQGSGIVNVYRGVRLVMEGGVFSPLTEWNPGTFHGTHYRFFTNFMRPGESYAEDIPLVSLGQEAEVSVEGVVEQKTMSKTIPYTTVGSDDGLMLIINSTGTMIYPFQQQVIDPNADMVRIDACYPYNYYDNGTDYVADTDYDLWVMVWHDDGDMVMGDDEWGVWALSTNYGPSERVVIWKPLLRMDDGDNATDDYIIVWTRPYIGAKDVPLQVTIESFSRTAWDWVQGGGAHVPAGGQASVQVTIAVPEDTPPGIYEGFLKVSVGDEYSLIPVTVDVPVTQIPFVLQENHADDGRLYQNDRMGGFVDWAWREEIGDWRFFFVDAPYPGADARTLAYVQWQSPYTDIDMLVLGRKDFKFKYIGNPPSSEFGNYTLDVVAQSTDTFTEGPGYVYYMKESTGPTSQYLAFGHTESLMEIVLHQVVPGGEDHEEDIVLGMGDVRGMASSMEFTYDETPEHIVTSGYFNITMTPDIDLPRPVVGSFGPAKRYEEYYEGLVIHQDNIQGINSLEDFIRALANGDFTYVLDVSGYSTGGRMFVHITSPDCPDLDLGLFYDKNGDHKAQPEELVMYDADEDADEKIELYNPPDGTYIIKVLGYTVPGDEGHFNLYILLEQELKPFEIVSAPEGPMEAGQTYKVTVYFDLLPAEGSYGGWVSVGFFNDSKVLKTDIVITFIDHVPPRVVPVSPEPESVLGPGTVHIEFVCDDNLFGMKLDKMLVTLDVTPLTGLQQTPEGNWYKDVQITTGGRHTITVEAWDWKGLYTRVSWSFYVDSAPPTIEISSPGDMDVVAGTVDVSFTATDETLDHVSATVRGPQEVVLVDQDVTTTEFQFAQSLELPDGLYTLTVNATDKVGNSVSQGISFYVDTQAPEIEVSAPQDGTWTSGDSIDVSFSVSDLTLSSVKVNGQTVYTGEAPYEGSFQYSGTVTLSEGANTITIEATDAAGHTSTATITVNRDSTAPTISVQAPEKTSKSEVEITVEASDEGAGLKYVLVFVNGELVQNYTAEGKTLSKTLTVGLQKGDNEIRVVAVDALGNAGEESATVRYSPVSLWLVIGVIIIGFVIGVIVGLRRK